MGHGVPDWLAARGEEMCPNSDDCLLTRDNGITLMNVAVREVSNWIKGECPIKINRYLDCFEAFCGKGGVTHTLLSMGLKARGFDRHRRGAKRFLTHMPRPLGCCKLLSRRNHPAPSRQNSSTSTRGASWMRFGRDLGAPKSRPNRVQLASEWRRMPHVQLSDPGGGVDTSPVALQIPGVHRILRKTFARCRGSLRVH